MTGDALTRYERVSKGIKSDGVTTFINASSCDVNDQPISHRSCLTYLTLAKAK